MKSTYVCFKQEVVARAAIWDSAVAIMTEKKLYDKERLVEEVVIYLKSYPRPANLTRLSNKALDNLRHIDMVKLTELARAVIYDIEKED